MDPGKGMPGRPNRRTPTGAGVSLERIISKLGLGSRSQGREWIEAGRVEVNGRVCREPERRFDMSRVRVRVDGVGSVGEERVYVMLNKPRGLVTTASDEKSRPTVYACLAGLPWVGPVGRLDQASEGLLLFTNDTRWGDRVIRPESHVEKEYHVQVRGAVGEAALECMRVGVMAGAERLGFKAVERLRAGTGTSWLRVVLEEGRNRQIRRVLEVLEVEVLRLVRVRVGSLELGGLEKGAYRRLTLGEVRALAVPGGG